MSRSDATTAPRVRPFRRDAADYEAVAALWNAAEPDDPIAGTEIRRHDEDRPDRIAWRRVVAEEDGRPVGFGVFMNVETAFHPQEFWLLFAVDPARPYEAVGDALWRRMQEELEPHRPRKLFSWAREDRPERVGFLEARGFRELMRVFVSELELASAPPCEPDGLEARLAAEGVRVATMAELADTPALRRGVWEVHVAADRDVPMNSTYTPPTFERFCASHFDAARYRPELFVVALDGDRPVGLSELWASPADPALHTGLTGVLPSHRRRGIALAMKRRAVRAARAAGAPRIKTDNASTNVGMLAINDALGFVRRPATIDFVRRLGPAAPEETP